MCETGGELRQFHISEVNSKLALTFRSPTRNRFPSRRHNNQAIEPHLHQRWRRDALDTHAEHIDRQVGIEGSICIRYGAAIDTLEPRRPVLGPCTIQPVACVAVVAGQPADLDAAGLAVGEGLA